MSVLNYGMTELHCGMSEKPYYGMSNWLNPGKKMRMMLDHSLVAHNGVFRNGPGKSL
jgi:hypothetical protein